MVSGSIRGRWTQIRRIQSMVYYPCRKIIGLLGSICFAVSIILTYQYIVTYKIAYAICDVVTMGLSVFLLMPVLRNQVVEVVGQSIIIHAFGKKSNLTADNLDSISRSNDGATSYRFSKEGRRYQVTPNVYTNSDTMLEEFERIFDTRNKRRKKH